MGNDTKKLQATGRFSLAHVEYQSLEEMDTHEDESSAYITQESCALAYQRCLPRIMELISTPDAPRTACHVVVLDPTLVLKQQIFSECLIFEASINQDSWDVDLQTLTRKKARVSYRTGYDSFIVQREKPWLYMPGDNKYGGAIIRDGLVISTAATTEIVDERISIMLFEELAYICNIQTDEIMNDENSHFIKKYQL